MTRVRGRSEYSTHPLFRQLLFLLKLSLMPFTVARLGVFYKLHAVGYAPISSRVTPAHRMVATEYD